MFFKNRTMKKIVFLLICLSLVSFSSKKNNTDFNFIGVWQDAKVIKKGELTFNEDKTASLKVGDKTIGGKDYYLKGQKANVTYTIDTSTNPINIDLLMHVEGYVITRKITFIAEIIDKNTFKIASNFNDHRPESFTKENSIKLKRKQ